MWLTELFKRGETQDNIWTILKEIIIEYFKAEGNREGKVNLISGLLIIAVSVIFCTTSTGVKLLTFIRPTYKASSLDGNHIFGMFMLIVIFFIYCMNRVTNVKRANDLKE